MNRAKRRAERQRHWQRRRRNERRWQEIRDAFWEARARDQQLFLHALRAAQPVILPPEVTFTWDTPRSDIVGDLQRARDEIEVREVLSRLFTGRSAPDPASAPDPDLQRGYDEWLARDSIGQAIVVDRIKRQKGES